MTWISCRLGLARIFARWANVYLQALRMLANEKYATLHVLELTKMLVQGEFPFKRVSSKNHPLG
jgi:hypothetical protein